MQQSLSFILVHLVFSTKDRVPYLNGKVQAQLHAYLATLARNAGCECYRAGGTEDHVHLAIRVSRTITVADLVEQVKTASSKWVKAEVADGKDFSWQRGYGCFSVGPRDLDALVAYIDGQREHHKKHTFQEEFRMLLKKYGIDFDEAYVCD
jgi:REP element-mobilizing transposase RayT